MAARLKVTQIKSKISEKQNQRDTLRSLGLRRIGDVVVRDQLPAELDPGLHPGVQVRVIQEHGREPPELRGALPAQDLVVIEFG